MNLLLHDNILNINNILNEYTTLDINIENINRLGLLFKNSKSMRLPFMVKNSYFKRYKWFSESLINYILMKNIKIIDIITYDINYNSFIEEASKLYNDYNIIINYSINKSILYSNGDIIIENNNIIENNMNMNNSNEIIDIKNIYFNKNINISINNLILSPKYIDLITFLGTDNIKRTNVGYKLLKNVIIDNDVYYYSILNSGEEFDGNNKSITISNNDTEGLFLIDADINNPAIIKNLKVNALSTKGGGIIRPNSRGFYCIECSWKGSILGIYDNINDYNILGSGGICGYNCTDFIIEGCKNKGKIGPSGGGICGSGCYNYTINNCKNYGNVIGDFSGGICGKGDLYPSTNYINNINININNNIKYCISEGEVIGNSSGGIYGSKCGFNNTNSIIVNVNIYRCINKGKINSFGSGGICGINCGNITYDNEAINNSISNVSITKCINYGNVHRESGGICGKYCCNIIDDSMNIINSTINVNINECKNYSNVHNVSGGIVGRFSNNSTNNNICNIKISKCRTKGNIKK